MENEEQWVRKWGWHIKPQALLSILNHLSEDDPSSASPRTTQPHAHDAIIAQLLDSDLKHVGSPSLPDAPSLQRISRLQGPLVLQVKLESTVSVQNGFLLGDARSFTILGGQVPALYESWEMERKYSGLARMTGTKSARVEGDSGPPPFHGLHVPKQGKFDLDKQPSTVQQHGVHSKDPARRSLQEKDVMISSSLRGKDSEGLGHQGIAEMSNSLMPESLSTSRSTTLGASSSHQADSKRHVEDEDVPLGKSKDLDVREDAIRAALALGVETAPLQNRAAAQKLLDKRADFHSRKEYGRGRGGRGRGRRGERQQEEATLTLEEWEAKRGVSNLSSNRVANEANTCDDEALAQRLHYQLNVETIGHERTGEVCGEADQIRLSMFSFAGDRSVNDDSGQGRHGGRGRGRGRGRRRGR